MTAEGGAPRRPTALVTGASRGIGRTVALRLAGEGYAVTLSGRDAAALAKTASDARAASGAEVAVCRADVADSDDLARLALFQLDQDPALDVLVLSAGVGSAGPLSEQLQARAQRQLSVNFLAAFGLVQALLPALRRAAAAAPQRGAKVIAIASLAGVVAEAGLAAYGASKAALIALCESITVEECGSGVTATAISPGYVDTEMSAWIKDHIPAAEMITADDVAELTLAACRLSAHAVAPNIVLTRPGRQLWRA